MRLCPVAAILLAALAGCRRSPDNSPAHAPPVEAVPVSVALSVKRSMPVELRSIGTVNAVASVAVKSLVTGTVQEARFTEGQWVRKGDVLFQLDPRPFAATVEQAEGVLARDRAQAAIAAKEEARRATLLKKGLFAQEEYDIAYSTLLAANAQVKADEAALDYARLQLSYCTIGSPIDGRTGQRLLDPGNLIKANDATMVVVNQILPIYVSFTAPEARLPEIRQYQGGADPLAVRAHVKGEEKPSEGTLTFVDNAVDRATGTVLLKATFPNADIRLWPGQFVQAVMTLTVRPDAIVVPSRAVQVGQEGQYVFVVKPDQTVEVRPVTVAWATEKESVIDRGLEAGLQVVTDGQLRLTPGTKVEIKPEGRPVAASARP